MKSTNDIMPFGKYKGQQYSYWRFMLETGIIKQYPDLYEYVQLVEDSE